MDFGRIYSDAIAVPRKNTDEQAQEKAREQTESATRAQVAFDWMQSTITQEMFAQLGKQIEDLLAQAETMAVSYPQHNNHQQIIHALVQANALRKVINQYARVRNQSNSH